MTSDRYIWCCKNCGQELEKRVTERAGDGREMAAEWWCVSCNEKRGFFISLDEGELDLGLQ